MMEKRIEKVAKKATTTKDKEAVLEYETLLKIKNALESGNNARSVELNSIEANLVKNFNLLSIKPIIYVANLNESEVSNPTSNAETPIYFGKIKIDIKINIELIIYV